jgi:hypothetical protein
VLAAAPYWVCRRDDGGLDFGGCVGELAEQNGFVFAWHHPRGLPPSFRLVVLDEDGWRPLAHERLPARTHPQEVYENSIDTGHFPVIHGYSDITVLRPMELRGHEMEVGYEITRRLPIPGVDRRITARFTVHVQGLGCTHNHVFVPLLGLRVRMFALATPTEPGRCDIRLGVSVHRELRVPLGPLAPLIMPLVQAGARCSIVNDFSQDLAVWEHKRYLRPPLLVKGDGPIARFRQWAEQFYVADAARLEVA